MSTLTLAMRQQISAAVGDWGDELMVTMKERLAQTEASEGIGDAEIHRLTGAVMLELCTIVGASLLATLEEKPEWIQTALWGSAAVKVIVPKIQERESVLIAKTIQNNVDVGKYTESLASNPQAVALMKEWGITTQKDARDMFRRLAQDLAAKHQRFITAAAPVVLGMAFDAESLSRLEGLLEDHDKKKSVPIASSSPTAPTKSSEQRRWWQFWR